MLIRTLLAAGVFLATAAWAQHQTDRDNLLGTWQAAYSDSRETWSLESKGDILRVTRIDDGKMTLEVNCKPDGTDCSGFDEGKKVTVIMYFNGSSLVQMETKDTYVTTRKFTLNGESGRMILEVNPITGQGKHYTMQLTRHIQALAR